MGDNKEELNLKLLKLLEKQKKELVVRVLQKHEEVQTEKTFTDKVIASLSDLFFVLNKDYTLVKANEEFCRSLGYSLDCARELTLESFVGPESLKRIREMLAAGEFKNFETVFFTASGVDLRVSLNGSTLVTESGRVLHMMVARDISDVHKMMNSIREAQEQLIHSGRLASLGEMAAGIGHELTQPLNAILLFARNSLKYLRQPDPDKSLLEENLQIIIDRVKKASSIIQSLKSFARKHDEEMYPIDINRILENILTFLDAQLKLSDIVVEVELAPDLPETMGHNVRLEQVFLNLIQNGVQAMGDMEKPRLSIRTFLKKDLDPSQLYEKDYIVVAIRDNGAGIPLELQGKIFDPFFTTREVGLGMGLGLSIVDRIVRGHGGFVKVESSPEQGSCFSVFLPVHLEDTKHD